MYGSWMSPPVSGQQRKQNADSNSGNNNNPTHVLSFDYLIKYNNTQIMLAKNNSAKL